MNKITTKQIIRKKSTQNKITCLTCYDATFAKLLDEAQIDILLVGDSLGMVIKGEENTLNVHINEVAYHTKAVCRGANRAHIVADLPFLTYTDTQKALKNAGKLIKAGANSVKLEGGEKVCAQVKSLVENGVPVMGHIGLTPQSINTLGGYTIQGKSELAQTLLLKDALYLQNAGAYALVLEAIPAALAQKITHQLKIPTIGIGAGRHCDGQVLVIYDLLHLDTVFSPKFVKRFGEGGQMIANACKDYAAEVKKGTFPAAEHSFYIKKVKKTPYQRAKR